MEIELTTCIQIIRMTKDLLADETEKQKYIAWKKEREEQKNEEKRASKDKVQRKRPNSKNKRSMGTN